MINFYKKKLFNRILYFFSDKEALFTGDRGALHSNKRIKLVMKKGIAERAKIEIRDNEDLEFGNLYQLRENCFFVYKNSPILKQNGKYDFYFAVSEYLVKFKSKIESKKKETYEILYPEVLYYKKRELRLELSKTKYKNSRIYCDLPSKKNAFSGDVEDISMNGFAIIPNSVFLNENFKVGDKVKNIHFNLGDNDVYIEKAFIRNIHKLKSGFEYIDLDSKNKKMIGDFILSYINEVKKKNDLTKIKKMNHEKKGHIVDSVKSRRETSITPSERIQKKKEAEVVNKYKNKKIYLLTPGCRIFTLISQSYDVTAYNVPIQAKIAFLKNQPDLFITMLFTSEFHNTFRHWVSLINYAYHHKIPIVCFLKKEPESRDQLLSVIKSFHFRDVLFKRHINDEKYIFTRINVIFDESADKII